MTDSFAFAGQAVSQLFSIIIFIFVVALLALISIGTGVSIWAALQVVKDKINQWLK